MSHPETAYDSMTGYALTHGVMLNLFQHPCVDSDVSATVWILKQVQDDKKADRYQSQALFSKMLEFWF